MLRAQRLAGQKRNEAMMLAREVMAGKRGGDPERAVAAYAELIALVSGGRAASYLLEAEREAVPEDFRRGDHETWTEAVAEDQR